jgi:hypothetical protein
MLPKKHLVVVRRRGSIKPKYLTTVGIAKKVIDIYENGKDKKYREIKEKIKAFEKGNPNYKIIRGLAELMDRKCEFIPGTDLNSQEVRSFLYQRGVVLTKDKRKRILKATADYFKTTPEEIENAMFGDLPNEQILQSIGISTPFKLIEKYNLSQTQTLLFNALELSFQVEANFQEIFRMINYFGLMYETDGKTIRVSGPASLFKKTRKYSTRLAKLLPYIMNNEKWEIKAKIEMSWGSDKKVYDFSLNSNSTIPFPESEGVPKAFDSEVESQFYTDFKTFLPKWKIKREPTFIKAGNYVTIPDFGFYRFNLKVYMEVVGFWTPSYLEKKIQKLNAAEEEIIVAVNENLKCSKEDFPGQVIFYEKKIPIEPILKRLRNLEDIHIQKQVDSIQSLELNEDIVNIPKKAKEMQINMEVLRKMEFPNYFIIGDKFISRRFLEKIRKEIGTKRKIPEIKKILAQYDLSINILNLLGFKIIWEGLIPKKIVKE